MHRISVSKLAALTASLALLVAACGSDASTATETADTPAADAATQGELTVSDVWSRQPAPGQTTAAVYAAVSNNTDTGRQIVAVTSNITDRAELHETVIDDNGVATMQARTDGFFVDAGETMMFEPGGAHVMLRDINPETFGESVDVVFEFDDGETIAVVAEIRNDLATAAVDPSDMDHDAMDMDLMDDDDHNDDHDHDPDDHHGVETLDIDVALLHQVDDELVAGNFDVDVQRAIVADYIAELDALAPADDSQAAQLLTLLQDLDAALEQSDLAAASEAATAAHDLAHSLVPHS